MPAPAQGAIDDQAVDGGEVVGLGPKPRVVEIAGLQQHVLDLRRGERVQLRARRQHARRLEFEPGLVARDLERLPGHPTVGAGEFLDRLPAVPGDFVVVPDAHERPACARILQVRILQVGLVGDAVVLQRVRYPEAVVGDDLALRIPDRKRELAIEAAVPGLVWVLHHFVDEVAQVQDEAEPLVGRCLLVFVDHPSVAVVVALGEALATDEGELRRAIVVGAGRGERAADAAAVAVLVDEAIPVLAGRPQVAGEHAAGPVGFGRDFRRRRRDDARERRILGDFDQQRGRPCVRRRTGAASTAARCCRRDRPTRRLADTGRGARAIRSTMAAP